MRHLLEHINQDIKREIKQVIRTRQYTKLNTGAKEIQQVNPCEPDRLFVFVYLI